jgi:hypothetical protein
MKVEIAIRAFPTGGRLAEIQAAFADEDVPIEFVERRSADGGVWDFTLNDFAIVASFVMGSTLGGVLYDTEKAVLRRGLAALKKLAASGIAASVEVRRPGCEVAEYVLPRGKESEAAFDAILPLCEAPDEAGGLRYWSLGRWHLEGEQDDAEIPEEGLGSLAWAAELEAQADRLLERLFPTDGSDGHKTGKGIGKRTKKARKPSKSKG